MNLNGSAVAVFVAMFATIDAAKLGAGKAMERFPAMQARQAVELAASPIVVAAPRDIGDRAARLAADPRIGRAVAHLHGLGPRAVREFVCEVMARLDGEAVIRGMLDSYGRLDRRTLRALGADRLPPLPIHAVRR